jgi:hypothetical protein
MTRDPVSTFMADLLRDYTQPILSDSRKWEWWTDGRRRSRTICITLSVDSARLTIAHRAIGTDGCMSQLHAFRCDLEHLPQLIHCLNRALAVARSHGLINKYRSDRRRQPKQKPSSQQPNQTGEIDEPRNCDPRRWLRHQRAKRQQSD